MTDELERLKNAMAASDMRADPGARKRGVAAAMAAFEREFSAAPQESADAARPIPETSPFRRRLIGRLKMRSNFPRPSLRPLMLGGGVVATALIAVTFVWVEADRGMMRLIVDDPQTGEIHAPANPAARARNAATAPVGRLEGKLDDADLTSTPREAEVAGSDQIRAKRAGERDAAGGRADQRAPGATRPAEPEPRIRERLALDHSGKSEARVPVEVRRGGFIRDSIEIPLEEDMASAPRTPGVVAERRAPPAVAPIAPERQPPAVEDGRERHPDFAENPVKSVAAEPVSTFSIDVDTASYAFVRSSLMSGRMPDPAAVRIEEMINYFPYDYAPPEDAETPFRAHVEVFPSPWKPTNRLVHIGIKGYELAPGDRPKANLVFLIDTSGSMAAQNKLPLLLQSFRLMLSALDPEDTVAIVAYAGSAGVVLEPTRAGERRKILAALDRLHSGGSTAGGEGLALAYALAEENFDAEGVNRVILATDGDFNVGVSDPERLKTFVAEKRKTGVGLSVLGFGRGNYNDTLMQTLAQNGDGNAAYIDSLAEAQKVMVEETASTLFTIARDVKIQVEWNPAAVSEYRLIGYETRALKREDFNNDKVDAGEIGAGHTVTAIYEITPVGAPGSVDPLRYAAGDKAAEPAAAREAEEYGFLKMRYKLPDEEVSRLITRPITRREALGDLADASTEARFATAVAGFGQLLRGGAALGAFGFDDVIALSQSGRGDDPFGYRAEFTRLAALAKTIAESSPARKP